MQIDLYMLFQVVSDSGVPARKARGALKPGFLKNTKGAIYGERGSTEGVLPENAGDPMGWLPKKLRQSCKIVDTASTQQNTPAAVPQEHQKMQKELAEIFDRQSYNSMWAEDVPQKNVEQKEEPQVSMETKNGQLVCTIAPSTTHPDPSSLDIELCSQMIRVDGRELPIPATVDETKAKARYSKKRNMITVTAPVV
ncbi:hypothetical protein Pmar_PMAR013736 [Perkinsus marinus ATCC 50983]|uniref:PIH1D1/2/3 CS-like domain-containing protein n=1 Tax=Perkinsus marinus (strain ATCC 50983 / TXsc) TaxID=423536 RepID=C5LY57_PERM5|nr:hypothetical protein Pmar_PMAR013736 [Perkinsus marinus ATCC 50983]EEQ98387.1 hypothetical protein Pmar_PMAR013736 [Perkinsus marinus ATCC 50983]|eukprot:XP_002765670.1 hypothetical protein Pmar_PMAR013736 [Perkinsus marinus ATCC 50983]